MLTLILLLLSILLIDFIGVSLFMFYCVYKVITEHKKDKKDNFLILIK